jgi:hypothetical protein
MKRKKKLDKHKNYNLKYLSGTIARSERSPHVHRWMNKQNVVEGNSDTATPSINLKVIILSEMSQSHKDEI